MRAIVELQRLDIKHKRQTEELKLKSEVAFKELEQIQVRSY